MSVTIKFTDLYVTLDGYGWHIVSPNKLYSAFGETFEGALENFMRITKRINDV